MHEQAKKVEGEGPDCLFVSRNPDGQISVVKYIDIQSPVVWRDNLDNLIHWIAVLRTPVEKSLKNHGVGKNQRRSLIEESQAISLCLDLDNFEKHGGRADRRKSEFSQRGPEIEDVIVRFPVSDHPDFPNLKDPRLMMMNPPGSDDVIDIKSGKTRLKYPYPQIVEVLAPVRDYEGNRIGEAFSFAKQAIHEWDHLIEAYGLLS